MNKFPHVLMISKANKPTNVNLSPRKYGKTKFRYTFSLIYVPLYYKQQKWDLLLLHLPIFVLNPHKLEEACHDSLEQAQNLQEL